ncbi:cell division protein CrgA [Rothia sp. ZJ932]|nr:cell division protein CrgA [Rothia sp. ZJ1223]MBM7052268.1 cell division protein CrgA [Rothia sp. ZJ1223]QRZ62667.1 cell division protein CrgA [Rothia sp. ZJ932]
MDEEVQLRRVAREMSQDQFASPTPLWYRVIMFGLMIIGVLWIMTYYISQTLYPIASIGAWNLVVGVGLMMIGLIMTTRWR